MILYINALGFSEYDDKEKAEKLVEIIVKEPTSKYISNYNTNELKVEYYKEFGENFGLVVRGSLNEEEELTIYSLIPYSIGSVVTDTHEIDVLKTEKDGVYNAYCEESKSGTPISFFLQNVIDYMEIEEQQEVFIEGVRLIGFSVEGTIILPIEKDEEDIMLDEEEDMLREELLEKARLGDDEALIRLEEEAIETSEILQERLKDEDILSILEGFFVPLEKSDDIYSILGVIEDISEATNNFTGEEIYILKVKCMTLDIDVFINKKELVGKPFIGMRFKGTTWIQGLIEFNKQ